MEEIIDLIATDSTPSEISDKIKEVLFAKSSEKIEASRPVAAASLFGFEPSAEEYTEDQE
jgi:hypothetical protein